MTSTSSRLAPALARMFLIGLLPLFLLPACGWLFSHHAIAALDGRLIAAIEQGIDAQPDMADDERAGMRAFIRAHPPSQACHDDDPRLSTLRAQVCASYGEMWQFQLVERSTALMLPAGVVVLCAALALGAYAFRNRSAQHGSFVLGWRLFTATAVIETVLQGALLVWLSFWVTAFFTNRYSVKLIVIAAVLTLGAVGVVVMALFKRAASDNVLEGELVDERDAPALWARVRQMAARLDTAPPAQIVAGIDTNFFVTEAPLTIAGRQLTGRTLFVSLPLLRVLDREEADAVLAHELGHFSGGDTASGARLGPKLQQYDQYCLELVNGGITVPWAHFMRIYRVLFELALRSDGREREFLADGVAARLVSAGALVRALIKVSAYALYRGAVEQGLFGLERQLDTSLGIAARIDHGLVPFAQSQAFAETLAEAPVPHPFDSHPPLAERMARVGEIIAPTDFGAVVMAAHAPGWAVDIAPAEAIESRLWANYEQRFASQHEQSLAYRYLPANAEEAAVVLKYFPNVGIRPDKGGELGVSYLGLHLPDGQGVLRWSEIERMSFENPSFGAFRLEIGHPSGASVGRRKTVIKLPGLAAKQADLGRMLGLYWQRDQVMRRHHRA